MNSSGSNQLNRIKFFNNEQHDFSGCTLLLPAVSVGNVGQLAIDLHLENLKPQLFKIGQFFHVALEPVVGNGGGGSLLVACEIFQHPPHKLVILQFYSPVTKRYQGSFVSFLLEWITSCNFQEVICLGSSLASLRNDVQLSASAMRYLPGNALNPSKIQAIQTLGWTQLELAQFESSGSVQNGEISIPGGGIARDLFLACNTAQIPILTLLIFASDGDNTPESTALVRSLNQLYQFFPTDTNTQDIRLRIPASWKYLNGGSEPASIF